MTTLRNITHLIIDMDGVLYSGINPMPRIQAFFSFLREQLISFILATNNSTQTPVQRVEKLARMGVTVQLEEILTSGQATALAMAREYGAGTRVHVFGSPALREAVERQGLILDDSDVDLVIASMDRDLTYEKLKRAALLIRGGARFVATNLDPTQPTEEGLLPGTGSIIALLETAAGQAPDVIGKPQPTMFEMALVQMGAEPETTAVIGDRLDTDILGAQRAGLRTICVLSGATRSRSEAEAFGCHFVFDDIGTLLDAWQGELNEYGQRRPQSLTTEAAIGIASTESAYTRRVGSACNTDLSGVARDSMPKVPTDDQILELARRTMRLEVSALESVPAALDSSFVRCAKLLINCQGLVWVTGVGTSAAVGQRFAHILSCCGVRAIFLSPSDGLHGHSAVFAPADLVVAMSRGGESVEVVEMARIANQMGTTTVAFVHDTESGLARTCQHVLPVRSSSEDELMGCLATTSTVVFSAVCDALCATVVEATQQTPQYLAVAHPGGAVGKELTGQQ